MLSRNFQNSTIVVCVQRIRHHWAPNKKEMLENKNNNRNSRKLPQINNLGANAVYTTHGAVYT